VLLLNKKEKVLEHINILQLHTIKMLLEVNGIGYQKAEQYGTKIEINDKKYPQLNMFTSCAYTFEGYIIQQMNGQGSVVRIDKI
jgi:hypothetical protein